MFPSLSAACLLLVSAIPPINALSWTATPFNPASVPLAVRSPYLSCWLAQGAGTALNGAWPTFWTGSVSIILFNFKNDMISSCLWQILGWAGYVRVDGTVYNFLGDPAVSGTNPQKAVQKSLTVGIHEPISFRIKSKYHTSSHLRKVHSSSLPGPST